MSYRSDAKPAGSTIPDHEAIETIALSRRSGHFGNYIAVSESNGRVELLDAAGRPRMTVFISMKATGWSLNYAGLTFSARNLLDAARLAVEYRDQLASLRRARW